MSRKRPDGDGDICERRQWRMQRAIRSGATRRLASKFTCDDRADVATGGNYE